MEFERCNISVRCGTVNVNLGKFSFASGKEVDNTQTQASSRSIVLKAGFPWIEWSRCQNRLASAVLSFCAITTWVAEETIKNVAFYFWHGDLF